MPIGYTHEHTILNNIIHESPNNQNVFRIIFVANVYYYYTYISTYTHLFIINAGINLDHTAVAKIQGRLPLLCLIFIHRDQFIRFNNTQCNVQIGSWRLLLLLLLLRAIALY